MGSNTRRKQLRKVKSEEWAYKKLVARAEKKHGKDIDKLVREKLQ